METLIILLVIIGVTGVIALVTFLIYRYTHPRLKESDKPTEEQILHEEMDRVLKPIDNDELRKEMSQYCQTEEYRNRFLNSLELYQQYIDNIKVL